MPTTNRSQPRRTTAPAIEKPAKLTLPKPPKKFASRVSNGVRVALEPKPTKKPAPAPASAATSLDAAQPEIREIVRIPEAPGKPGAFIHVGDCREILRELPEAKATAVDLIFADPPFNWKRAYDRWDDALPEDQYLSFTFEWLSLCARALRPGGSLWVNIPDDWAAEIVCYLKGRLTGPKGEHIGEPMEMHNWCIWHYRFGQNTKHRFINSKVHALHFVRPGGQPTWNASDVLEMSDRAAIYGDPRTLTKSDGMPPSMRVPMDVWYGQFWGRVQGNNLERRNYHDNQLPEVYLERVVLSCSNAGDVVIDPFTGSGTTGVVARDLGRRFIGCEFSRDNAHLAGERIMRGALRLNQLKGTSSAIAPPRASRKPRRDSGA